MGTTIILAWIVGRTALLAWRGDSRGYLYRPGKGIEMITQDHSLVWDYVKSGKLTPQEADVHPLSNILLRSLGNPKISQALPDTVWIDLQPGDRLLLCSDGLNSMVSTPDIERIVGQPIGISQINEQLIAAANTNGGEDNITVVLLEMLESAEHTEE
jgi:PPM family protein phosphatase